MKPTKPRTASRAGARTDQSQGAAARPVEQGITRFGLFELDLRRRELRRKGIKVALQHQPFEILKLLVAHRGDFVTRELIQETLWPDGRFVDFERSINTAIMKLRQALRESASSPAYIETVPRSGYRLIAPIEEDALERKPDIIAIAVLPLQDFSGLPDGQYFVDGLTDALITEMARRSRLRVVSRLTMSRYKDSSLSVQEIAAELNVQAIVEGSVMRSADRIRISARLLDAIEDRHLWAQTYERELQDILRLHEEVATAIVSSAARALSMGAAEKPARPVNPAAYDRFLRGNFFVSMRSGASWEKAVECYRAAISMAPDWASPYAGLAEVYRLLALSHPTTSGVAIDQIIDPGHKALELDPDCSMAHATLGAVAALHQWRWAEGEQQIQHALALDSQSSHVEYVCATVHLHRRQYDQAIQHIDAARSIEHSSLFFRSYRTQVLIFARRFAEALRESEEVREENQQFAMGLMQHGAALLALHRAAEALPFLQQSHAVLPLPMAVIGTALAQFELGRLDDARQTVASVHQLNRDGRCSLSLVALGHAILGEHEQAIRIFQMSFERRDVTLPLFSQLPMADPLRSDSRMVRIFRQLYAQ